ncbi:MAG: hypothetical protein N3F03_08145 [Ignavibacteria bacterium]|nr:hypothetical protein [Ignavibacteria bacterium]
MKQPIKIHRRNFLKSLGVLALTPFIQSCESSVSSFWGDEQTGSNRERQNPPNVDILLEGTEEQIAKAVQNKHSVLQDLYNNPGKELSIGFLQDRTYNTLKISFAKTDIVSYPHLRIVNTRTSEIANVIWGIDGIYPSIKFVDNSGKTIIKNGKPLEFALNIPSKLNKTNSPADWIKIGIKIFGIALLLWIGASIVKYVAAAIAFIAFNAMAIGLVIAGAALVIQVLRWILDRTGITLNDIVAFFVLAINSIVILLIDVMNYIISYFGG